jgi:hypothetical protein
MASNAWSEQELKDLRALDIEVSQLVSKYLGDPWPQDSLFVPTQDNLAEMASEIAAVQKKVGALSDTFWREHLTGALESLAFQVECNTKLPYEHITRISSSLDRLMGSASSGSPADRAAAVAARLSGAAAVLDAVLALVEKGTDLARSQVADVLPALGGNLERAEAFVRQNAGSDSIAKDAVKGFASAASAVKRLQAKVKSLPLSGLDRVDIPFAVSVEKGMQAPLDYILSWYEEDAVKRGAEYFRVAKEMFPGKDPAEVLDGGPRYESMDAVFAEMRGILDNLQSECTRFVDLPEGEFCDIGLIPETWRMMVPGFMYMGGLVALNPESLATFRRAGLETTAAHEVYPGHHVHHVKSAKNALPYTFRLPLFWSRCHQEGICDRSMAMMTPYFKDPAARLSVAKRMWFTANRVKAEVDIYYNKKPIQAVIDNYMTNLGLPSYNAHAQTRAHMMRPADAISYYTGMKFVDDLYKASGIENKAFTNELFSYGEIPLNTQKNIFALSPEKKEQLKTFTA